jgi:hypothetical protein
MAQALAPWKTWKESRGHAVKTVTLDWIHANYSGVDVAEGVWNFLKDKYPAGQWGIRYVLLVGDLQVIPTRRVYYADAGWGLRSDHFFAKLSGGATSEDVWNGDGDHRWGEVHDDEMTVVPDVLVGRIPLNDTANVGRAIQAMIRFEKDNGSWKHNALLAGGLNDIVSATDKTDNAVLLEMIRTQLLDPNGWDYARVYEQTGLGVSTYTPPPDYDTSRANVIAAWNEAPRGLAILADHADGRGFSGHVWNHDTLTTTNATDPGEWAWTDLFDINDAGALTTTHPSLVSLMGCFSLQLVTAPWPNPDQTMSDPGGYSDNTGRRLMATGAAAGVVGFYSPVPYLRRWDKLAHGNVHTVGYYFAENLVQKRHTLGQALFETKIRYNANFYNNNYQPFHWALNLFGDPAMVLEGYDDSARGRDKLIHNGPVYDYGTDNDDNGDMYVAVSTRASTADGQIVVYKSTNHGETWSQWATIGHGTGIRAVDTLVVDWELDEMRVKRLHVFYTDAAGAVLVTRLDLANPATRDTVTIANEGATANLPSIAAARDPMPMPAAFNLYVAWEVAQGSSHRVKFSRSTVGGGTWSNTVAYDGYQQPHVDAGTWGRVYLVAVANGFPNHVHVKVSADRGATWGGWANLTSGDGADAHAVPVVAASTDAAFPTAWVAYNYYKPVVLGGGDLRYAYTTNSGGAWTLNQVLSSEQGVDERMPDMVGYRARASRWMNIAYDHTQSARTNVVWRWVSGSTPSGWWAGRTVNDYDTHPAIGPQVIYSPGAAASGSGVVYPGTGSPVSRLYFAAPWLTLNPAADAQGVPLPSARSPRLEGGNLGDNSFAQSPPLGGESAATEHAPQNARTVPEDGDLGGETVGAAAEIPYWAFTGPAGQAFRVAHLAVHPDGRLYAAATTKEVDGANTGALFASPDGGQTWELLPHPPLAWWLDSLLVTRQGTLLAGGTLYEHADLDAVPQAAIYRSTDGGEGWEVVAVFPEAVVVHALLQRANGQIVAGTGPGGWALLSPDDGQSWEPMDRPPNGERLYALCEDAEGMLYAGGMRTGGGGVVYRWAEGRGWEATGGLDNANAVHALLAGAGRMLYAGAGTREGRGAVYRSSNRGQTWLPSAPLGDSAGVGALLEGPDGMVYAGLAMAPGRFTSQVVLSEDRGGAWHDAGQLFMADVVHDLLLAPDGTVYVASGDTYGVIYRARLYEPEQPQIFLPLVINQAG